MLSRSGVCNRNRAYSRVHSTHLSPVPRIFFDMSVYALDLHPYTIINHSGVCSCPHQVCSFFGAYGHVCVWATGVPVAQTFVFPLAIGQKEIFHRQTAVF